METAYKQQQAQCGGKLPRTLRPLQSLMTVMSLYLACVSGAYAVNLTDVEFSAQPGGRFEVRMDFDGTPPEPKGYKIEKPARIALDLEGVSNQLSQKKYALEYGNANSAVILESGGRTRMILNLVEIASYKTRIEGNSLYVDVGDEGVREYLKPVENTGVLAVTQSESSKVMASGAANAIDDVDFRRGDDGEGRLVVKLANPDVGVNVFVEGGKIKVALSDVVIPEQFQRRYDVTDFATPVLTVDARATRAGALFSLEATGDYDYLAYQADNEYVLSVKSLTPDEVETRKSEFAYVGDKLSLNFQDIEVRAVLQLIADFTDLNLVASDTVKGRITLRLQNVPWDQALELVLKTKGLDKRQVGNVLMVAPAAEIAARERQELQASKQIEELAPLQTEHIRIRYADAAEMYKLFEGGDKSTASILSTRGSVIVDERTNSLLVTETAQKLEEFRRVVNLLDIPIRQVLIEARIVIANDDFEQSLGATWGTTRDWDASKPARNIGSGALGANGLVGLAASAPSSAIGFSYLSDHVNLALELTAMETMGNGEVVSQPKVVTGDKQQAVIKSGQEIPYQQSAANGETTVSFKEAVLKLEVTPSITPDDRIIMDLVINQDSVAANVDTTQGDVPIIDTTEIETQVLVANGETVVLGGIFKTTDVVNSSEVPFLGSIPYLGRLFRSDSINHQKQEILIFITPRILSDTLID